MRQPREKVRAFLIRYQDRVLWGTDLIEVASQDPAAAVQRFEARYRGEEETMYPVAGHIPGAHLTPLARILTEPIELPDHQRIVLVCRSGRRSARAAATLAAQGQKQLVILQGGMLSWQAHSLLEAIE